MDLYNLPEPWDVQIYYPGESIWTKPARCRNVYMHLRGAGGSGGAGESGVAGTKRGGGSGGTGGWVTNYFGPSLLFEDQMVVSPAANNSSSTIVRFMSTPAGQQEFRANSGGTGIAGVGGVGGPIASYANAVSTVSRGQVMGILEYDRDTIVGRTINGNATTGGYAGGGTISNGGGTLAIFAGGGGAGITDTYIESGTPNTRGGGVTTNGGQGNGILASPGNLGFLIRSSNSGDGGSGQNGDTAWVPGKAMYLSIAGAGGNGSVSGTGGRGGNGGIGCGGGGGGAGVTGGAGGTGGHGIVIIITW